MKKAVVCVSFGTSVPAGRENITAVENVLRQAAQDRMFISAFTSPTIRRILRERGETVYSPAVALEALRSRGVTEVLLQPTHILRGHEYDKLKREAAPWREKFDALRVGRPLLSDTEDLRALAAGLSDLVYPALQTAFRLAGRTDVLVGTVEGWPAFGDVLAQLKGGKTVHLVPLMLVAGDHALNDMAGADPDSWKSRLEAEGFAVRASLRGLGVMPAVQAMYRAHLEEELRKDGI